MIIALRIPQTATKAKFSKRFPEMDFPRTPVAAVFSISRKSTVATARINHN